MPDRAGDGANSGRVVGEVGSAQVPASVRELSAFSDIDHVDRFTLATDRSLGRVVWTPLSATHRRLAPGLLRSAATPVARRAGNS